MWGGDGAVLWGSAMGRCGAGMGQCYGAVLWGDVAQGWGSAMGQGYGEIGGDVG